MIISKHARKRMEERKVTEEEIKKCITDGEIVLRKVIKNEMRFTRSIDLADKRLSVVYTVKNNEERVITCFPVKRE